MSVKGFFLPLRTCVLTWLNGGLQRFGRPLNKFLQHFVLQNHSRLVSADIWKIYFEILAMVKLSGSLRTVRTPLNGRGPRTASLKNDVSWPAPSDKICTGWASDEVATNDCKMASTAATRAK